MGITAQKSHYSCIFIIHILQGDFISGVASKFLIICLILVGVLLTFTFLADTDLGLDRLLSLSLSYMSTCRGVLTYFYSLILLLGLTF